MVRLFWQVVLPAAVAVPCQPAFTQQEYSVVVNDIITEGQALLKGEWGSLMNSVNLILAAFAAWCYRWRKQLSRLAAGFAPYLPYCLSTIGWCEKSVCPCVRDGWGRVPGLCACVCVFIWRQRKSRAVFNQWGVYKLEYLCLCVCVKLEWWFY